MGDSRPGGLLADAISLGHTTAVVFTAAVVFAFVFAAAVVVTNAETIVFTDADATVVEQLR